MNFRTELLGWPEKWLCVRYNRRVRVFVRGIGVLFGALVLLAAPVDAQGAPTGYVPVSGTLRVPERLKQFRFNGARLVFYAASRRERVRVQVRPDGSYSTHLWPGITYQVQIESLFFSSGQRRLMCRAASVLTLAPNSIRVARAIPPEVRPLELKIEEGEFALEIQVETRDGLAIPGVPILLSYIDRKGRYTVPYGLGRTDAAGRVRFDRLPRGRARATQLSSGPYGFLVPHSKERHYANLVVGRADDRSLRFEMLAAGVLDVTVDPRGRKEPPPVALWKTDGTLVAGPVRNPTVRGSSPLYRFESVRPGRYRVVATYDDGKTLFREVVVRPCGVTPLLLTSKRARPTAFELTMRWENFPPDSRRVRLAFTPLRKDAKTTMFEAARGQRFRKTYGPGLQAGSALVRYPALGFARMLTPNARANWILDVTPPPSVFLANGSRTVTVRVRRNGKILRDLLVGLRKPQLSGTRKTRWMRYSATTATGCVFRNVPAGWHEVRIIDGVLGVIHGVPNHSRPLTNRNGDVVLDWSIDGER